MTTPAVGHRSIGPGALVSLLLATLLVVVALTAAILDGSRVRCPSTSDSSPSRPMAQSCAAAAAPH